MYQKWSSFLAESKGFALFQIAWLATQRFAFGTGFTTFRYKTVHRTVLTFEMRLRLSLGTVAFDSNSLHCSNEKQESKMDSYYFKWWRLFQLLLSGNACPAFGATPHRRALRLVAVSGLIRFVRSVAPPLPTTRGVSGTPGLICALAVM